MGEIEKGYCAQQLPIMAYLQLFRNGQALLFILLPLRAALAGYHRIADVTEISYLRSGIEPHNVFENTLPVGHSDDGRILRFIYLLISEIIESSVHVSNLVTTIVTAQNLTAALEDFNTSKSDISFGNFKLNGGQYGDRNALYTGRAMVTRAAELNASKRRHGDILCWRLRYSRWDICDGCSNRGSA